MAGAKLNIRFVDSTDGKPYSSMPTNTKRQVRSHAARARHVEDRRRQVAEYQSLRFVACHPEAGQRPVSLLMAGDLTEANLFGPERPLSGARKDPFASFAGSLTTFEQYLLDHYMLHIIPCSEFRPGNADVPDASGMHLRMHFVRLAMTSIDAMLGLLLVACRHLSLQQFEQRLHIVQLALQYKIACARSLAQTIAAMDSQDAISDAIIGLALFLAQDEILLGEAELGKRHLKGARDMLSHNSSFTNLYESKFLRQVIYHNKAMT